MKWLLMLLYLWLFYVPNNATVTVWRMVNVKETFMQIKLFQHLSQVTKMKYLNPHQTRAFAFLCSLFLTDFIAKWKPWQNNKINICDNKWQTTGADRLDHFKSVPRLVWSAAVSSPHTFNVHIILNYPVLWSLCL